MLLPLCCFSSSCINQLCQSFVGVLLLLGSYDTGLQPQLAQVFRLVRWIMQSPDCLSLIGKLCNSQTLYTSSGRAFVLSLYLMSEAMAFLSFLRRVKTRRYKICHACLPSGRRAYRSGRPTALFRFYSTSTSSRKSSDLCGG